MSVDEVAQNVERAAELLPLNTLEEAHQFIGEATDNLYTVTSGSNDTGVAEVFDNWQHATAEIARSAQLCAEVQKRISTYRVEMTTDVRRWMLIQL